MTCKREGGAGGPHGATCWYLQCTRMGPEKGGLTAFTFFRNLSIPMGEKGTPKSGQLVKWSCVTSRGVLLLLSLDC